MIRPVVLWTDALVFLLTLVVAGFILYARSKPHLPRPGSGYSAGVSRRRPPWCC